MRYLASALLTALLCSCAMSVPEQADDDLCGQAAVDAEVCADLHAAAAGDELADDDVRMRGIIVERVGNRTYFKIPFAYLAEGDQRRLLEETLSKFTTELGHLNREISARGVDLGGVLDEATRAEFHANYEATLAAVLDTHVGDGMETLVGEHIEQPRKLRAWQRYLVPQAFVFYFGTKFSVNLGIGGGVSATIMVVVQPWMSIAVDHTSDEPIVVDKKLEVDAVVLGIPNVDVGFGAGGGLPIRIGAGAVFGPLDHPNDLAGWGAGLSGSFGLPIAGGGQAKIITALKNPPLFLAMAGYQTGTAAELSVHGNLQYLMDLGDFIDWINTSVGGIDPEL
ncbi:MAG: hypothetical protein KJO07_17530 [Deltaproteobacteria bacterium]|nr:hypothetical protein [Deltaproteobacteria bacterium]